MELLQLEYFLKVARVGNMSAAAEEMNVAQSSVSRSIARLEDSLGFPLFERSGRNIALNEYGKLYYRYAERALQELEDGKKRVAEYISGKSQQLSFSVPVSRLTREPLVQYLLDYPDVKIRQLCLPDIARVKEALAQGEVHFALTYQPVDDVNFAWRPLLKEHFYFIVSKSNHLAGRDHISLRDLDGERVVMNECDDPQRLIDACNQVGSTLDIVFCGNEIEGLGRMIEGGIGGAFIPAFSQYERDQSMPEEMRNLVSVIRIEERWFARELGIVTVKHRYMPETAKEFDRRLRQYYADVAPKLEHLVR